MRILDKRGWEVPYNSYTFYEAVLNGWREFVRRENIIRARDGLLPPLKSPPASDWGDLELRLDYSDSEQPS